MAAVAEKHPLNLTRFGPAEGSDLKRAPGPISIVSLPLHALSREGRAVAARPGGRAGVGEVQEALRGATPLVIADLGQPLRWVEGNERFRLWKDELRARLVPPDLDRIFLHDYPDERCYTATLWTGDDGPVGIVFQQFH